MAIIDVAVPCFQYGRYLRQCVLSITNQKVEGLRVLIIDNGSTDDSFDVAQELANHDRRIEIIRHRRNQGPTKSYNDAIDWASSKYFLLVDADDFLAPDSLRRAISILDARPDVCFAHGVEARLPIADEAIFTVSLTGQNKEDWTITSGDDFISGLIRTPVNRIGAPTVVRRTELQKRVGYYRSTLPFTDDLEMWLRLALFGKVAETKHIQAVRRIHHSQMSRHYKTEKVQVRDFVEREAAFSSFFAHEGRNLANRDDLMVRVSRNLGSHAYWSAASHLCRGHPGTAASLLKFTAKRHPTALLFPPVGWLIRMGHPLKRVRQVISEAVAANGS